MPATAAGDLFARWAPRCFKYQFLGGIVRRMPSNWCSCGHDCRTAFKTSGLILRINLLSLPTVPALPVVVNETGVQSLILSASFDSALRFRQNASTYSAIANPRIRIFGTQIVGLPSAFLKNCDPVGRPLTLAGVLRRLA